MKNTFWKIAGLLLWVGTAVIASQLVVGYLAALLLGPEIFASPVATAIYSAICYALALFLVVFIPPRLLKNHKKSTRKELGLKNLPTWTDIGLAPVGFFVYLILAAGITAIFNLFPWFNAEEVQNIGFNTFISGGDRIIAFITLVVIAPIFEEIIFRGWLYAKLRNQLLQKVSDAASMIISIFLVSLLFGIVHLQWNVGVNVFALSIVLCGLREITGTIYASILLHMLKNGIAFYALFVLGIR